MEKLWDENNDIFIINLNLIYNSNHKYKAFFTFLLNLRLARYVISLYNRRHYYLGI